jgi:hypothetical protein
MQGETMSSFQKKVCRMSQVLFICFALMMSWAVSPGFADNACYWNANLYCEASWFSTGCVGLRNASDQVVFFEVNYNLQEKRQVKLNPSQSQNADFKEHMFVMDCFLKDDNGKEVSVRCSDYFRVGKNNDSGGGCGCKNFECLSN